MSLSMTGSRDLSGGARSKMSAQYWSLAHDRFHGEFPLPDQHGKIVKKQMKTPKFDADLYGIGAQGDNGLLLPTDVD